MVTSVKSRRSARSPTAVAATSAGSVTIIGPSGSGSFFVSVRGSYTTSASASTHIPQYVGLFTRKMY